MNLINTSRRKSIQHMMRYSSAWLLATGSWGSAQAAQDGASRSAQDGSRPSSQDGSRPSGQDGARAYDVHDLEWIDERRGRAVPARLYRPTDAKESSVKGVPIVLFSHGLGGSRTGYQYLARFLASKGVACFHPQHVGSDRSIWSAGSPFLLADRLLAASGDNEAIARVLDLRFCLDRLQADRLSEGFDFSRLVVAGHSYGANSALLMGGARVLREGRIVDLQDARPRAVIAMSAPAFYGESSWTSILASMNRPSLHITCSEDLIRIPGLYSGPEDRVAIFKASAGLPKCFAMFEGGSHSVFTDREATGGFETNRRIKGASCELVFEFLKLIFEGDQNAIKGWQKRHESMLSQFSSV